jgi:hypothetical protein
MKYEVIQCDGCGEQITEDDAADARDGYWVETNEGLDLCPRCGTAHAIEAEFVIAKDGAGS